MIRGRRLPIVGQVSMGYITVDVGGARAEIGDEAILGQGTSLPVEEAAEANGTITADLWVKVGARVRRIVVDSSP